MREGSPNNFSTADPKRGSRSLQPNAKCLFQNILAASPCGSIFYPDPVLSTTSKPLRMNTLADPEKNVGGGTAVSIIEESPRIGNVPSGDFWLLTRLATFCNIVGTSSFFIQLRGGPEFHAEWLRDEPCDATATDPGSYIPGAWCQLSPGNREHGIRQAHNICIRFPIASFPFSRKKRPLLFRALFRGSSSATHSAFSELEFSDFEFAE
jgi:hypothetical protein